MAGCKGEGYELCKSAESRFAVSYRYEFLGIQLSVLVQIAFAENFRMLLPQLLDL
jgi:hypothetical protein